MKKNKKMTTLLISLLLILSATFTACNGVGGNGGNTVVKPSPVENDAETKKIETAAKIDLSDLKNDSDTENLISLEGDDVVIETDGEYIVTGNLTSITLKKGVTARVVLNNVTIKNTQGVAIATDKKCDLTLTVKGESTVENSGDGDNCIHVKGTLKINGDGVLNVKSTSKSAIKVTKEFYLTGATLNLESAAHGVNASTVVINDASVTIADAKKDGLHAECDYDEPDDISECTFTLTSGFVSLINVNYTASVYGDGIQADTFCYIDGGNYDIKTIGNFVLDNKENREEYDLEEDDFRYVTRGNQYYKVESDYRGTANLYALAQGCKGVKVGEIEFDADGDGEDDTVILSDANYCLLIKSGTFNIDTADDAFHANSGNLIVDGGTFTVRSRDDAFTADVLTKINGGEITVTYSYEGIEGGYVEINGGTISVYSADDGINAASDDNKVKEHIIITDGNVTVSAEGDGLDSNGTIWISGGNIYVYGPTGSGNSGLDADGGTLITGGEVFVTSSIGMVELPGKNSKQKVVSYGADDNIKVGVEIKVEDENGNVIFNVTTPKKCQSIIVSSAKFSVGATYKLYIAGELKETFTISETITSIGKVQQGGGFGGGQGGPAGGPGDVPGRKPW